MPIMSNVCCEALGFLCTEPFKKNGLMLSSSGQNIACKLINYVKGHFVEINKYELYFVHS